MKINLHHFLVVILCLAVPFCSFSQDDSVTFDAKYIKKHDGKVTIEVNEVQELTYIMMAISDFAVGNSDMLNRDTDYYQAVQHHFSRYKTHPAISLIDSMLTESIINYILLSANAYGFKFDGPNLVATNVYTFPAKQVGTYRISQDPIKRHRQVFEDFAEQSDFRKFYRSHKHDYDKIHDDFVNFGAIHKQKQWLEERFDYRINSYLVLTSPLIGGINATTTFEDNHFKQTVLCLPTIKFNNDWTPAYGEAMNSRIIFTEIDHNYVGTLSEQFLGRIDQIFDRREIWVNKANASTAHYPTPIKVFDEYLTWGLFILYAYDAFPGNVELHRKVIDHVNEKMSDKGFPRAESFNKKLVELYRGSPSKKIEAIYPDLLDWASTIE